MPRSAKEQCYDDLKFRILKTELEPGAIMDETSMAARYGLSRTPLREVLQRLSGEGYISLEEQRGAKVCSMDVATMRTFFQTAPMVYANISRLAAENRKTHQVETLQTAQVEFAKHTQSGDASAAALSNHRFHAIIGQMANNPYLVASLNRLLIDHTRLSQTFYSPKTEQDETLVETACAQHDALISAIDLQQPALAVELTLQHWDLSRDRIEQYVRPDPLPVDVTHKRENHHAV